MKKGNINLCFQFLSQNVSVAALGNPETRVMFIKFYRELRKIAMPIIEELEAAQQPPLNGTEEAVKQIVEEEYTGELPKISEDLLLEILSESKCDYPIMAVLNTFEGFIIKDE